MWRVEAPRETRSCALAPSRPLRRAQWQSAAASASATGRVSCRGLVCDSAHAERDAGVCRQRLYENVFPRVCFSTRPFGTTPLAPVTAVPLAAAAAGACACRVCGYETTPLRCTLARARARDAPAQWARRLDCRNCWFSADHGLHADLCTLEIYQRSSTGNKQRTTLRFTARHPPVLQHWLVVLLRC